MCTGIEQCKHLIKNWEAMEEIDFDFQDVLVDGLFINKQANDDGDKWDITLFSTMHTNTNLWGRDYYSVLWRIKGLFAGIDFFSYQGYEIRGALSLGYNNLEGYEAVDFSIVQVDDTPIFTFYMPEVISVASVVKTGHQTLEEVCLSITT